MKLKTKRQISKHVRFNYFEVMLKVNQSHFKKINKELEKIIYLKSIKKLNKKQKERILSYTHIVNEVQKFSECQSSPWDMNELLNLVNDTSDTTLNIDGIIAEIEPNSFIIENDTISFQLTKLRDNFLIAKKKIGKEKEDILLGDDEYIGEFVSLIFDCKNKTMMLQSNMYALGVTKVEQYLTKLRKKYLNALNGSELFELECELRIIIDPDKIKDIIKAQYFKKIRIKGSDFMLDSFLNSNSLLGKIRKNIGKSSGINFDVSISVQNTNPTKSIDVDEVENLLSDYKEFADNPDKPMIEITKKDDDDSNVELINLLEPRLTDIISFSMYFRQPVGHQFLYGEMIKTYKKRLPLIEKILSK